MNKEIVDYLFMKFETLTSPAGKIIMDQIPVEVWKTKVWIIFLAIIASLCIIAFIICIVIAIRDSDWVPMSVISFILSIIFVGILIGCIIDSKQLELNPKYYMAEKLLYKIKGD